MSIEIKKKRIKEKLSKTILKIFKNKGFNFTELDFLIDTDILAQRSGESFKKFALTYVDSKQNEVSLRPDLTIATALKYIREKPKGIQKYCYQGTAFKLSSQRKLTIFEQIGCEIINSKFKNELQILDTLIKAVKNQKKIKIVLNDVSLFSDVIDNLELPNRWKLRLKRHYSRKEYFEELLNRLGTNYDLKKDIVKVDYERFDKIKKLNKQILVAGRSYEDIIDRFERKKNDPRDNIKGEKNTKIIRDFLKIRSTLNGTNSIIENFYKKNNLRSSGLKNFYSKINLLNKKISKNIEVEFVCDSGRETSYYTGLVFSIFSKNSEIARGGEYNNLIKSLGYSKSINAFGGAINLDILSSLK